MTAFDWYHEVDPEWLLARRKVLTATDIVSLLPAYRRWKKKGDPDFVSPEFSAMWALKHSNAAIDTSSRGSAARGHIMEPWAIKAWNNTTHEQYHHWDDLIIVNGNMGFSPDAMDEPQPDDGRVVMQFWEPEIADTERIMEVKCYEDKAHMEAVCTKKMDHKEIYQIAMAFAVLPGLTFARLLWVNPNAPIQMHSEEYCRDELKDQISLMYDVDSVYQRHCRYWDEKVKKLGAKSKVDFAECDVWRDWIQSQQSNTFVLR